MNKICSEDLKNAKKIRMRCPYCGKWHDVEYDVFGDLCFSCETRSKSNSSWRYTLHNVDITINEESQELNICMNHPCLFLNHVDEEINLKIPFSEFKREKEKISITKFVELDMYKVIEEGEFDSSEKQELIKEIEDGCKNCKGECKECLYAQGGYKLHKGMFAMLIEIKLEFILEKNESNETEESEAESKDASEEVEAESEYATEEPEVEREDVTEEPEVECEDITEEAEAESEYLTEEPEVESEDITEEAEAESEYATEEPEVESEDITEEAEAKSENVTEESEAKGEKYLEVLVPFVCVAFAAYEMKGDDTIKRAKETFGIDFDCLKDKKNLKRIEAIGLVTTTAAITYFNGKVKKAVLDEEAEYDEVSNGLNRLIKAIKPWESTIKKVLPAAIAICAVAIFNGKKFENIKEQLEGCALLIQDKFGEEFEIDEDVFNEKNLKKFVALIGITVVIFMVYGKKLDSKDNEEAKGMIKQIIPIISPLIPAVIVFAPKMKTFFQKYGYKDIKKADN